MNVDDFAALAAYTAQFRGETVEETALAEYEGKRYRVTAELEDLLRGRANDRWTWATQGTPCQVVGVYSDGRVRIAECKALARWEVGNVPPDLLVEVME